ncbi:hypothetical protein BHE74_00040190 [Ensete ventricosum]|nr:hypothetical protein BHE74_00040190 [Ensete ventricosum]
MQSRSRSRVSIGFCALSRKFKILAIPNVLALDKTYEHGFTKKYDGHKLCAKSYAKLNFNRFFVHRKFKMLVIPNVLAHERLYEHNFTKRHDGHKLCTKSSFDRFFVHPLGNSKYWSFQTY